MAEKKSSRVVISPVAVVTYRATQFGHFLFFFILTSNMRPLVVIVNRPYPDRAESMPGALCYPGILKNAIVVPQHHDEKPRPWNARMSTEGSLPLLASCRATNPMFSGSGEVIGLVKPALAEVVS